MACGRVLRNCRAIEVPSTVNAEPKIRAELAKLEDQLAAQERAMAALYEKFETDTAEAESLQQRIDSINDDFRKYKDLRKVRKMGRAIGRRSSPGIARHAIRNSRIPCSTPATRPRP